MLYLNYIEAAIFGITQGITEFLPISSTGHLIFLHYFFNLPIANQLAFDVILHFATLLAVVWFFRQPLLNLIKSWLGSFTGKTDQFSKLAWLIILGTLPAALAGYFFENIVETSLRSPSVVIITLILIGIFLIIAERYGQKTKELNQLNWQDVILIGLSQASAIIPGVSRSGITIIAGLAIGLKRKVAAEFSLLLSLPIIFAAAIKKVPQLFGTSLPLNELLMISIAFIFSLLTGILTIKYFLDYLKNNSLNSFAFYRFILAIIIFVLLLK